MVQNGSQFQSLLLPILIILIIGIVTIAGWLIWLSIRSRRQSTSAVGVTRSLSTPASAEAQPTGSTPPAYTLGVKRDTVGGWEIYVKGQRCRTLAAVSDSQTREEATSALRALAGFAKGVVSQAQPTAPPVESPSREIKPTTQAARPVSPLSQRLAPPAQTSDAGTPGALEPPARRITPLRGSLPTIDFAYEINGILDELLVQTPALQGHTVVLQNIPGGINFFVDGTAYDEIADIPSAEIQALIRQATREWERR